jgi:ABC-type amino acid transport substrate-binding protein
MLSAALKVLIIVWALVAFPCAAAAQDEALPERKLIVGTKEAPPFAMKSDEGVWKGISIDLWRQIARELDLEFEFREMTLRELIDGVTNGTLDAAVAALTITPAREKVFDFTHPFHTTGLGIAVPGKTGSPWFAVVKRFFSTGFLQVVAALCLLLLAVGFLVWWFEHKRNAKQFGGGTARGIGSAFWWSAVTMTTVGYGDKAPATLGGRSVALVWMFAGIIMISGFTAAIASSLTVTQLDSPVKGPEDLPKVRVGAVSDSTGEAYLRDSKISFAPFRTVREGLAAAAGGDIDAMVYDAPIMRYLVKQEYQGKLQVLSRTFMRQDYSIALPDGSPLRERINRALLEQIGDPFWQDTLFKYLGR